MEALVGGMTDERRLRVLTMAAELQAAVLAVVGAHKTEQGAAEVVGFTMSLTPPDLAGCSAVRDRLAAEDPVAVEAVLLTLMVVMDYGMEQRAEAAGT